LGTSLKKGLNSFRSIQQKKGTSLINVILKNKVTEESGKERDESSKLRQMRGKMTVSPLKIPGTNKKSIKRRGRVWGEGDEPRLHRHRCLSEAVSVGNSQRKKRGFKRTVSEKDKEAVAGRSWKTR